MADIGEPDVVMIKKRLEFKKDDLLLKNKEMELRILELEQEIKRFHFEIENNGKEIAKVTEELKAYN